MKPDLLTLTRHEYAKRHPDRDTRQMPLDDTILALAAAIEGELDRLGKRLDRLEAKSTAKDAE
ncbi:MAG: hypothetical protein U0800_12740 [Isosphaeraceae bacterium]